ncbi:MAG TPA: DNA polymerase III subunit delta' [Rudaea sp.]|nr:DNA polymerase III subunit delta' [Rudaea sp.]
MSLATWHRDAWSRIVTRRARGTMPHALLLCGPPGLGKREFALALTHALLCEQPSQDGEACSTCRACRLIAAGSHPDKIFITLELRDDGKPRTEIVVDQIRALGARTAMTAQFGGFQIARIDPADSMNQSAGNALLKTLEEPTPATVIILIADQPSRLPATIRSRCQRIDFHLPSTGQALDWLQTQGIEAKPARAALQASSGNPGLALEWLRCGGLALREEVIKDLRALRAGRAAAVDVANRWSKSQPESRLWFVAALAQAQAHAQTRGDDGPLALTAPTDLTKLSVWFEQANRARVHLRGPLRPELVLLDALANWGATP